MAIEVLFQVMSFLDLGCATVEGANYLVVIERGESAQAVSDSTVTNELSESRWTIRGPLGKPDHPAKDRDQRVLMPEAMAMGLATSEFCLFPPVSSGYH